jgi:hypothetical protein
MHMKQRGRKSAASLDIPAMNGADPRLDPPSFLNSDERQVFIELTASASHLRNGDVPLLTSLAQATVIARRAVRKPGDLAAWERAVRIQAMLSTRLRLTPQARTHPANIARQQQTMRKPSAYDTIDWESFGDDEWPPRKPESS